ncbi:PAS domain-containing protein [Cytophagaceae bacterium ABcell3]|nr:PAS domain-containing protein [Cytophagaceae bacterium ABcell3]
MQDGISSDPRHIEGMKASSKLTRLYILALSAVALLTIAGQFIIQHAIKEQNDDAHVVNLSGCQRYMSQQIVKFALMIRDDMVHQDFDDKVTKLEEYVIKWKKGHKGLQEGDKDLNLPGNNSEAVQRMFQQIDPYHQNVAGSALAIIDLKRGGEEDVQEKINYYVEKIIANENAFFEGMDAIVHQYDREAQERVAFLKKVEAVVMTVTLFILLLEGVFIFRPAAKRITATIVELIKSEARATQLAAKLKVLNASLERSLKDLNDVNFALDKSTILAKTDKYGLITYVNEKFSHISGYSREELIGKRFNAISGLYHSRAFFDNLWDTISSGEIWNKEIKNRAKDGSYFWLDTTIVPVLGKNNIPERYIAIYTDVTQKFKQRIIEQKIRSASLIEGQEKERKKTARELHDGLGQMLTALKFNVEGVKGVNTKKEKARLDDIKKMLTDTIQEVRRISFNLMPSVLNDFGVIPACKHLCELVSKHSDTVVSFSHNQDKLRLSKSVEVNLYRILQEALNNAVKYSGADKVVVDVVVSSGNVKLSVMDNGRGFPSDGLRKGGLGANGSSSGNGIANIQERCSMMGGDFKIQTAPGEGTKITITVPLLKDEIINNRTYIS